ncbi:MAG TPA: PP2C family protein-serine/threonine phosphatase, partial [candidate division Zixibacteria bacterium]|nr:PP2C family protein-serine/threonine phosphatase [candidate division Zixibacteria bacterium]
TMVRVKDSSVNENPVHMGMALTGWMIKHQRALNISRANDPDGLLRHMADDVKSALSVPLRAAGKMIGSLTVFNKRTEEAFDEMDQRFLSIVAGQSAQVIESARLAEEEKRLASLKEELKVAGRLQASLMPIEFPIVPGYDVFGRNVPAGEVGGDCYDVLRLDEHRVLLSLGDVSGKGASAALLMANAQAIIRSQFAAAAGGEINLSKLVKSVSEYIAQWSGHEKYITLFLGVVNAADHTIEYVNAGHNPPMIWRKGGTIETLESTGIPMGMFPGMEYEMGVAQLEPNSRLVIFTDGVTELFNEADEEFGEERLEAFLHEHCECDSPEFAGRLYDLLEKYRGKREPSDDITLLTVRRL